MFISKLNDIVENYDLYGEHRVNGLKATYIVLILYFFNLFLNIQNPYFYYFYAPITALTAEMAGDSIKEKYTLFFSCLAMAVVTIILFDTFRYYFGFFIFVFFYSLFLYFSTWDNKKNAIFVVPVALALGAYSLLYENLNMSWNMIFNNSMTLMLSLCIILGAMALFPRSYYYRLWRRTFSLLICHMVEHLTKIKNNEPSEFDPVKSHTSRLHRYANMLPRRLPTFSILKINVLANHIFLMLLFTEKSAEKINPTVRDTLLSQLSELKRAIDEGRPCPVEPSTLAALGKMMNSWNYLCSRA